MIEVKTLFTGSYTPEDISIINVTSSRKIDATLEAKIVDNWEILKKEALEKGKKVWDSELYRLDSFKSTANRIVLQLSTVNFSTIKGITRFSDEIVALGEEYYPKSLFTNAIIMTSDNKYIIGKNSGVTMNTHDYEFIGGVVSKSEHEIQTGTNVFEAIHKELQEEIHISPQYIASSALLGGLLTHKLRVVLVFSVQLTIPHEEVQKLFQEENDGEIGELLFLEKEEMCNFLTELNEPRQKAIVKEFLLT